MKTKFKVKNVEVTYVSKTVYNMLYRCFMFIWGFPNYIKDIHSLCSVPFLLRPPVAFIMEAAELI